MKKKEEREPESSDCRQMKQESSDCRHMKHAGFGGRDRQSRERVSISEVEIQSGFL